MPLIRLISLYFWLFFWPSLVGAQLDVFLNKITVGVNLGMTYTTTVGHKTVNEISTDQVITHDLDKPKAGWSQHLGLLFFYPLNPSFSLRTELQFIHVRTHLQYTTTVIEEPIGLIQENTGTLELAKRYIQVPLSIQFTPTTNDRISLYAGIFYNGQGMSGGGNWVSTQRNYATNYLGPWVLHDPPYVVNSTEKKGFSGRGNIGWLGGGEFSFPLSPKLRGLIGIRYNSAFRLDNTIPPFRRQTWLVSFGLRFI